MRVRLRCLNMLNVKMTVIRSSNVCWRRLKELELDEGAASRETWLACVKDDMKDVCWTDRLDHDTGTIAAKLWMRQAVLWSERPPELAIRCRWWREGWCSCRIKMTGGGNKRTNRLTQTCVSRKWSLKWLVCSSYLEQLLFSERSFDRLQQKFS